MTMHVLVEDRSKLFRESLRLLLQQQEGVRLVTCCENAGELVERARALGPDGIVFEAPVEHEAFRSLTHSLREMLPVARLVALTRDGTRSRSHDANLRLLEHAEGSRAIAQALRDQDDAPREPIPRPSTDGPSVRLTRRELHVLALLAEGLTTGQMAERLEISSKTIENHRQSLFAKLGVQNQSSAVAVGIEAGLLAGVNMAGGAH